MERNLHRIQLRYNKAYLSVGFKYIADSFGQQPVRRRIKARGKALDRSSPMHCTLNHNIKEKSAKWRAQTKRTASKNRAPDNSHVERPAEPGESLDIDLVRDKVNEDLPEHAERVMTTTETSSKIYESLTYDEALLDPVHSRQ